MGYQQCEATFSDFLLQIACLEIRSCSQIALTQNTSIFSVVEVSLVVDLDSGSLCFQLSNQVIKTTILEMHKSTQQQVLEMKAILELKMNLQTIYQFLNRDF